MWGRAVLTFLCVMSFSTLAESKDERWYNFAEDSDLRYYIDQKSVVSRSGESQIFWVKSVAKSRDYFREEYNLNNLAYLLTSYEIDCSDATYRVRQTIMMDRNRRALNKSVPAGAETEFEPIPPESALELAQETVCATTGGEPAEEADEKGAPPAKSAEPAAKPEATDVEEPAAEEPGLQ